ncbi:MAG: DUF5666 domain-containing protein [Candidatus Saccharimonadales bacterium]
MSNTVKAMINKKIIGSVVGVVILAAVGGGAFYGGITFRSGQLASQRSAFSNGAGGARVRFQTGSNFITGAVTAKDSQSLTVKMPDGSSRIILYSPSTEVSKYVSGSASDVAVGSNVMISGQTNSDGSITAQSIQLRPAGAAITIQKSNQ